MNKQDINKKLTEIFSLVFGKEFTKEDNLSMENFEDWSSLKHIELIVALEEYFEVSIKPENIPELTSKEKIIDYLSNILE